MNGILIDPTLVRLWIDASKEETRRTEDLFRGGRKKDGGGGLAAGQEGDPSSQKALLRMTAKNGWSVG
jgi:hypothetical protein